MRAIHLAAVFFLILIESLNARAQESMEVISSDDYVTQLRWDSVALGHLKPLLPLEGKPTKSLSSLLSLSESHDQIYKAGFGSSLLDVALGFSRLKLLLVDDRIAAYELQANYFHDSSFIPMFNEAWSRWMPGYHLKIDTIWSEDRSQHFVTRTLSGIDSNLLEDHSSRMYRELGIKRASLSDADADLMKLDYEVASNHVDEVVTAKINKLEETYNVEVLTQLLASHNPSIRFQAAVILESFRLKKTALPRQTLAALAVSKAQDAHASWVVTRPEWIGSSHFSTFADAIPRLARLYAGQDDAKKYNNPSDEMWRLADSLQKWQYAALDRTRVPALLRNAVARMDSAMISAKALNLTDESWLRAQGFGATFTGFGDHRFSAETILFRDRAIAYQITIHDEPYRIREIMKEWNAEHKSKMTVDSLTGGDFPGRRTRVIHYLKLAVIDSQAVNAYRASIAKQMKLEMPIADLNDPASMQSLLFGPVETRQDRAITAHIRKLGASEDVNGLLRAISSVNASARLEAAVELEMLRTTGTKLSKDALHALALVKDPNVEVEWLSGCIGGSSPADEWITSQVRCRMDGCDN